MDFQPAERRGHLPEDGYADGSGMSGSIVTDHAFMPDGEWWSLCVYCSLAESAHERTGPCPF
jgi:hypothetical protein